MNIEALYGSRERPVSVVGSVGTDAQGVGHLPTDLYPPESKTPVSYGELNRIKDQHGIQILVEAPGQTGTNFAAGLNKLGNSGDVRFLAPFDSADPHSGMIREALTDAGVTLDPIYHNEGNPYSLVVANGGKVALVAKPDSLPPIKPELLNRSSSMLVVASLGGKWAETYNNLMDAATEHNIPTGLIGSESQIKKLAGDEAMNSAYKRVLTRSTVFLGNDTEAEKILEIVYKQEPAKNPKALALQLHNAASLGETSLTFGKDGGILVDEEQNLHVLRVKPAEKVVGTVGAGDANAAAVFYGRRNNHSAEVSMVNAALSSKKVIGVLDSLSGQMRAPEWRPDANAQQHGMQYEVHTPRERRRQATTIYSR